MANASLQGAGGGGAAHHLDTLLAQAREEAARVFASGDDEGDAAAPPPPPVVLFAAPSASAAGLSPCPHQAGGHHHQHDDSGLSASMVDASGRFYKVLPEEQEKQEERGSVGRSNGGRARREVGWYERCARAAAGDNDAEPSTAALARLYLDFMPRYHGVARVGERWLLALDDVSAAAATASAPASSSAPPTSTRNRRSAVLDAKLGKTTAYAWAHQELRDKCVRKDAATTQASLGFRLCGVVCRRRSGAAPATTTTTTVWSEDRHWGKALDGAEDVRAALRRFGAMGGDASAAAEAGAASAAAATSRRLALLAAEVARLRACLEQVPHARMFSASALLLLEEEEEEAGGGGSGGGGGAGGTSSRCSARVVLVDFAHAFWRAEEEGPDINVFAGLDALREALLGAAAAE